MDARRRHFRPDAHLTGRPARAALEAVRYQTRDLLEAMQGDWKNSGETVLRVDGGCGQRLRRCNSWLIFLTRR
ncbi:MAG: hypothetical protein R3D29_01690 [Nitratireductor sp.]